MTKKVTVGQRESLWLSDTHETDFPQLSGDLNVDVIVVGAGITGLTAAYMLKQLGKRVAVVEQRRVASGDSGRTTAHLTEILDSRYYELIKDFGKAGARIASASSRAAIDQIEALTRQLKIDCDFKRVPGFLFSESGLGEYLLKRELKAAEQLEIHASFIRRAALPGGGVRSAVRFENQARFHPRKYLQALAQAVVGDGCLIFENTHVSVIEDGATCEARSANGTITADQMIVATHSPVSSRLILHTKIAAYRTYVVAVNLPGTELEDALYWDTQDPYHYIRRQGDLLIVGGEDHKTGMAKDPEEHFKLLEAYTREHFTSDAVSFRWSGQVINSVDGLPYIGKKPFSKNQYIATGFGGNGMTFGTLSGMILSDAILNIQNPWAELYKPSRIKPLVSAFSYLSENKDVPLCFLGDRVAPAEASSLSEIMPGQGKLMKVNEQKLAVYRDFSGKIKACSAVCPHLGCLVHWNDAEASWDCPCHGSRFDTNGEVLNGPAIVGLDPLSISETKKLKKRAA